MEYESLFALGPLCGVDDPNTVIRAAGICDDLGMDTISAGVTIAWAMGGFAKALSTPMKPAASAFGSANAQPLWGLL